LKGVQTSSQVSHPYYTANNQLEDEESSGGNGSPNVIHFKNHLSQTETEIFYLDFVDEFYPIENNVQTVTKDDWVKEDNTVVSSSHPPQETIVFKHRTTTVKASPFTVTFENIDVKKVIEQNNYTNQYLNSIGNQLDKIEKKKIDNKPLPKEKHKPFKQEKPIIKFPELKLGTSLKVNKNKSFVEKIEDMLKDLVKTKQEQHNSSNTVSVANISEFYENSSETESSSESESDVNIR
jgi:hypothetical protein